MEQKIGRISHYFDKIGVGVIELTDGGLSVGDSIRVQGHATDFTQVVSAMQIEHQDVPTAEKGQSLGLKTDQPVKENDVVYKVTE